MKKHFFLFLLSITFTPVFNQVIKLDSISGKYQSTGIVLVDSIKKDTLFLKTKEWIALNYKSANDVIQFEDKESSKIIIKGSFPTNLFLKEGWLEHTLVLDFKDGKFKYLYTDFSYYSSGSGTMNFENNNLGFRKKIITETEENISSSISSLLKYLTDNSKKINDW
jgi:Domain of unknown function (DUF4468) with TBP-like fold